MADFNGKVATPDTDGPADDNSVIFGADSQAAATPKVYTFGAIKAWLRGKLPATATNDDAAAGDVGQFVTANLNRVDNTSLVSGTPKTVVSISLGAGDWDVWGSGGFSNGTSATLLIAAISTVNNTLPSIDGGLRTQLTGPTFTGDDLIPTPQVRLSLNATTTVYLVVQATFTGITTIYGTINARRRR